MADMVPITVTEGNDETIVTTINRVYLADDLMLITKIEFWLKDDDCDDDAGALLLSSSDPTQAVVDSQTSAQIVMRVFLPAAALVGSYPRFYRVDGLTSSGKRRTAVYGPVTVNNV